MCSSPLSSGRTSPRLGRDTRDRIVEAHRLDRDDQEVDGLVELVARIDAERRLAAVGLERQAVRGDRRRRLRPRDADDALARRRHPDGERAAHRPRADDRDRHACAGSVMRFTYFHSE